MTNQSPQPSKKRASVPLAVSDALIREMEEKCDLLQYTVDGWSVWPLLRFLVQFALTHVARGKAARFPRSLRLALALQDLPGLLSPRRARYVVKTYNAYLRSEPENGLYRDIFFDDLLVEIGDYFKIESVTNRSFVSRRKSALIKSDVTTTFLDLLTSFLTRVGGPRCISGIASDFSACLMRELDLERFTPEWTARILRQFYWAKQLYRWLLARIQPEYLFLTSAKNYALVAAAKELQIKTVEFQHGAFDRHKSGYSWSTYALDCKIRMPIPDRIFLYGDYWKQELEANGFWKDSLRSVGSLQVDRYRQHSFQNGETYTIVLTTQSLDVERVIAFVAEFLEIAKGQLDFRIYIRLHPSEPDKEPYTAAFGGNKYVQVFLSNEQPPTLELLARADFHAAIYSTCHYEALGLGTPTIILPFTGYKKMLHLLETGYAFLARTPQDMLDIIFKSRCHKVPGEVGEQYFKPGAVENMKRELGILLG